jgi:hypothetical protein
MILALNQNQVVMQDGPDSIYLSQRMTASQTNERTKGTEYVQTRPPVQDRGESTHQAGEGREGEEQSWGSGVQLVPDLPRLHRHGRRLHHKLVVCGATFRQGAGAPSLRLLPSSPSLRRPLSLPSCWLNLNRLPGTKPLSTSTKTTITGLRGLFAWYLIHMGVICTN